MNRYGERKAKRGMTLRRQGRHHYGASGYVKPSPQGDSPLTPWGEQLARVQNMCTEGYCNLSQRDKDDIRAVYHRMLDLTREAACPCCAGGTTLPGEPCQECHGKGLVSCAYDTLRFHYKRVEEVNNALLEAVKDALAFLDRPDITTYEWYKLAPEHVGKFRRAIAKAEGR